MASVSYYVITRQPAIITAWNNGASQVDKSRAANAESGGGENKMAAEAGRVLSLTQRIPPSLTLRNCRLSRCTDARALTT